MIRPGFPLRQISHAREARRCSAASVSSTAKSFARISLRVLGQAIPRHDAGRSAPVQSPGDKIVSIVTRSVYGDEQLAASNGARINRDTGQPGQGVEPRGRVTPRARPLLQPSTA